MENNGGIFKLIYAAAIIFIVWAAYYGNYLPLRKSQIFITILGSIRSGQTSIEELKRSFSLPLTAPSPIGQEEFVRNITNVILNFINTNDDPAVLSQLADFVEENYEPIIERGTGMSFGQNLYILGAMNEAIFIKTKDPKYFEKAKYYFSSGLELGPNRPQPLYGLFDIYRLEGNMAKAQEIADKILSQWPDDERTKAALADFFVKVAERSAEQNSAKP